MVLAELTAQRRMVGIWRLGFIPVGDRIDGGGVVIGCVAAFERRRRLAMAFDERAHMGLDRLGRLRIVPAKTGLLRECAVEHEVDVVRQDQVTRTPIWRVGVDPIGKVVAQSILEGRSQFRRARDLILGIGGVVTGVAAAGGLATFGFGAAAIGAALFVLALLVFLWAKVLRAYRMAAWAEEARHWAEVQVTNVDVVSARRRQTVDGNFKVPRQTKVV